MLLFLNTNDARYIYIYLSPNCYPGYPSSILQKVELPILKNDDCELWFQSQGKKITLLASQFCAGYKIGGKDACRVSLVMMTY